MPNFRSFGPLIAVVSVSNTHCSCMKLQQIIHNAGWLEYDPVEIWKFVMESIETAYKNLLQLEINTYDIIAVGICTVRGVTLLWDKQTGAPFHNAIGWTDCRCIPQLKTTLNNVNYNENYIRSECGLPLSTCFSALKVKWLMDNVEPVNEAMEAGRLCFGTLDSWLIWNLTGAELCGAHVTDVTNAQYTSLMNIHTMEWDKRLCNFFRIPMNILPRIRSNSEIFGYVIGGVLNGIPIASCIGDQPASLLGQLSVNVGQNICTIDDSCFVLINTSEELIESEQGLLSIVAYKLGPKVKACYALEGAISNAGASVNWLKENMNINTDVPANDNAAEVLNTYLGEGSVISSSCSSSMLNSDCSLAAKRSEVIFVPAFHGLYAPYWRYDARGIIMGLNSQTLAEHVTQAAFEATGFQIHEVWEAIKNDTPNWEWKNIKERLVFGGDYADNTSFIQCVADIVGFLMEKPQTISPAGLGAMIAAGITMKVLDLKYAEFAYMPPSDVFTPTTTQNRRLMLYKRWQYAVKKCLSWNNFETYEADLGLFAQREHDPYLTIRRSLPGSIFLTTAFALLILGKFLQTHGIS